MYLPEQWKIIWKFNRKAGFFDFYVFNEFVKSLQNVSVSNKGHNLCYLDGLGIWSHLKDRPDDQLLCAYNYLMKIQHVLQVLFEKGNILNWNIKFSY